MIFNQLWIKIYVNFWCLSHLSQIMGIEIIPFTFSLSGECAWQRDCDDILQWLQCQVLSQRTPALTIWKFESMMFLSDDVSDRLGLRNNIIRCSLLALAQENYLQQGAGTHGPWWWAVGLTVCEDSLELLESYWLLSISLFRVCVTRQLSLIWFDSCNLAAD